MNTQAVTSVNSDVSMQKTSSEYFCGIQTMFLSLGVSILKFYDILVLCNFRGNGNSATDRAAGRMQRNPRGTTAELECVNARRQASLMSIICCSVSP